MILFSGAYTIGYFICLSIMLPVLVFGYLIPFFADTDVWDMLRGHFGFAILLIAGQIFSTIAVAIMVSVFWPIVIPSVVIGLGIALGNRL